ncbi:MAG TPA: hypothetical protein DDW89_09060 [Gammaproteobacteria bacterium]|nr:hypothetical protein [Gammaproteobacteria bacterium]
MDLLDCTCSTAFDEADKPYFSESSKQIQCPLCGASTPPCDTAEDAAVAWNAMQLARRDEVTDPTPSLKVEIPIVVFTWRDGFARYKWCETRGVDRTPQQIAAEALGVTLMDGVNAAAAYVVTATLPVPQPWQVVKGSAEAVGIGGGQPTRSRPLQGIDDEDEDTEDADG